MKHDFSVSTTSDPTRTKDRPTFDIVDTQRSMPTIPKQTDIYSTTRLLLCFLYVRFVFSMGGSYLGLEILGV